MQCAIEVIAEQGFAQASVARIARRAGVSKSVVLYHFEGRDELIDQVVAEVFAEATSAVRPQVAAASSAVEELRAYIQARVRFLGTHRAYMLALFEIWTGDRTPDGRPRLDETTAESTTDVIDQILRRGQQDGEFGQFDTRVMSMAVRQAIDGVLLQLRTHPDLDLEVWAGQLVSLFDRATRRQA